MNESDKKSGVVFTRVNRYAPSKLTSQIPAVQTKMKNDMVEEAHAPIIEVRSGTDMQSAPGLEELLELAGRGRIDYVYVSGLDRFGRTVSNNKQILSYLNECSVKVRTNEGEVKFSELCQ
jgi:DNA invertase Pin-like site-specific DNA recombinase